jgi:2-polyprenyl-3-methyl-5-hydroxy-6-metoxy-1,4-benzoquinol methylase
MKKSRGKNRGREPECAKAKEELLYPYSRKDISEFFSRKQSVRIAYLKIERGMDDFGHYLCDIILDAQGERIVLQGVEFLRNRFHYPAHLEVIPPAVRKSLEQQLIRRLIDTRVIETPLADPELAYTGERVVPGTAPFHAYWMHARRYAFAAKRCGGKRVLDAGCGSGYGTRILSREARECLGVDIDPEALRLAASLFAAPGLAFAVADVTTLESVADQAFEVAVALEVLEHLPPASIPDFLATVRRVLATDGTFVVSVANRVHHDKEENPLHRSEMLFDEFREWLETRFRSSRIGFFGQDVWAGTWHLDRECRIEPIRSATSHHVYIAVVEPEDSK